MHQPFTPLTPLTPRTHAHRARGFTLVELMAVVALIAIGTAAVASAMVNLTREARATAAGDRFERIVRGALNASATLPTLVTVSNTMLTHNGAVPEEYIKDPAGARLIAHEWTESTGGLVTVAGVAGQPAALRVEFGGVAKDDCATAALSMFTRYRVNTASINGTQVLPSATPLLDGIASACKSAPGSAVALSTTVSRAG